MIHIQDITGLVLAGGKGARMGGVDKGLQAFRGLPLALHTLLRLQLQTGSVLINANRNLAAYEAFGAAVWPDVLADYAGPLAGFLTGLEHCATPWLLTVPCDTPFFPLTLATRLAAAAEQQGADIAMAAAPQDDGAGGVSVRPQPVFCLLRADLLESLAAFTQAGGRKIDAWTGRHACAIVPFDEPGDDPQAFFNANTLAELHRLERSADPGSEPAGHPPRADSP
ncbi:molybdenum cofactor guanylyltransferase MobA [Verminephrobacter aporrectodeae]|uniref:molybdenum cofactor guanylyltransferase MobA n=1 Tax=Verminephrobacter aporrectodeae TaxID=1110389 RepID=UPI002238A11C|nr:molybdenum cofactor guanylyltransferase MobA [Verminephrobacter aporrectodeae]MCW5222989.1 molybdenum cofactor guanylyltransferase MobA [Verminephrobacter aporrectodeae subsp. tuberculatae]MCW5288453.1 molybdenum cofactor guanylyltransferase MobA [Verminephrobacter aporrectodeae subsp. tuberculatae]MCW8174299.1 molybdenum cofactor guanylyltransferase MobA [Verminephrobacter aporrectodeae subsp. tuberculatae]MCW8200616.1 molybdenum cofactor guanylyltransferase MobA [Verminephrobacter aporrect